MDQVIDIKEWTLSQLPNQGRTKFDIWEVIKTVNKKCCVSPELFSDFVACLSVMVELGELEEVPGERFMYERT